MGVSQVVVTNRALRKIGASTIASPSEQSAQGRTTLDLFETVARTELRKHAWSFAMLRTKLAAVSTAPAWGYTTAYQLPSDCLRLVYIDGIYSDITYKEVDTGTAPDWVIEGQQLLNNLTGSLPIRYVSSTLVALPNIWDDCFVDVFACALAIESAPTLTKSAAVVKEVSQMYLKAVFEAKRANAIETPPRSRVDSSWVTARASF